MLKRKWYWLFLVLWICVMNVTYYQLAERVERLETLTQETLIILDETIKEVSKDGMESILQR